MSRTEEAGYRVDTLKQRLHPKIVSDLLGDQKKFVQKYPHTKGIFDGLHYVIYNKSNRRPFPKDFDEDEFLEQLLEVMSRSPEHENMYADGIRYDIGNGIVTTFPILTLIVSVRTSPVPFSFD